MSPDDLADLLSRIDACKPARDYCDGKTLREAWYSCPDWVWMSWFLCAVDLNLWRATAFHPDRDLRRKEWMRPETYERIETAARSYYAELLAPRTDDRDKRTD